MIIHFFCIFILMHSHYNFFNILINAAKEIKNSYVQDNTSWQSYLVYLLTSVYTTCEELPLNQLNTLKHT